MLSSIRQKLIQAVALYLEQPSSDPYISHAVPDPHAFHNTLKPCDIILMEGDLRYSQIIKYVTQSQWTHCGIYIGDAYEPYEAYDLKGDHKSVIEVLLSDGTVVSPLKSFYGFNTRILRPVGLTAQDKKYIVNYCLERVGTSYDISNVLNLFLKHTPFLRMFFKKKEAQLGSDDPDEVICSSLIAQAFQSISYPILPDSSRLRDASGYRSGVSFLEQEQTEIQEMRKRHYSLFTPKDFDLSPFFQVIKPTLEEGFNYKSLNWLDDSYYF